MADTDAAPYAALELISRREALALPQQRAAEILELPLRVLRGIESSAKPAPPVLIAALQRWQDATTGLVDEFHRQGAGAIAALLALPPSQLQQSWSARDVPADLLIFALGQTALELAHAGTLSAEHLQSRTAARAVRAAVGLSKSAAAAALGMTLDQFRVNEARRGLPAGAIADLVALHAWTGTAAQDLVVEHRGDAGRRYEVLTTFATAEAFAAVYQEPAVNGRSVPLQLHHVAAARRAAAITAEGRTVRLRTVTPGAAPTGGAPLRSSRG